MSSVQFVNVVTFDGQVLTQLPARTSLASDESAYQKVEVADGQTAFDLFPANMTTATALVIVANQNTSIKVDGGDTGINLIANKPVVFNETSMTALTMANSSGSTAVVHIWVWGT